MSEVTYDVEVSMETYQKIWEIIREETLCSPSDLIEKLVDDYQSEQFKDDGLSNYDKDMTCQNSVVNKERIMLSEILDESQMTIPRYSRGKIAVSCEEALSHSD